MTNEHRPRADLERAADACESLPGVLDARVLTDLPAYDVPAVVRLVLAPEYDRAPPRVLRVLAEHDCGVRDVTPQGDPAHLYVEAR